MYFLFVSVYVLFSMKLYFCVDISCFSSITRSLGRALPRSRARITLVQNSTLDCTALHRIEPYVTSASSVLPFTSLLQLSKDYARYSRFNGSNPFGTMKICSRYG